EIAYFTEPADVNAWCHGAAGIGLSRLRALELLNKASYHHDVQSAVKKIEETDLKSHWANHEIINCGLCHGVFGNLELFLETAKYFQDEVYFSVAEKMACKVLDYHQRTNTYVSGYWAMGGEALQEDLSLFMGNAGIGYFFLRMANLDNVPSVLAPKIEATNCSPELIKDYPAINLSIAEAHELILEKSFHRTLAVLESSYSEHLNDYFETAPVDWVDYKEKFAEFVDGLTGKAAYEQISDILALELTSNRIDAEINSYALLFIKQSVKPARASKILAFNDDAFLNCVLERDSDIEIVQTSWDWSLQFPEKWNANLSTEPDDYFLLLKPSVAGIEEIAVYPFAVFLLQQFEDAQSVGRVVQLTEKQLSPSPAAEKLVRKKILDQIKQLVAAGILLPVVRN
ncbi:MAG: hypothetical protein KC415_20345, partial [Anaerolineales bacterium]|nr:hypothetical protein [Anaerolineales bacterium]